MARKDFADAVYKLYIGRGQWRHVVSGMCERIWAWIPFPSLRRVVRRTSATNWTPDYNGHKKIFPHSHMIFFLFGKFKPKIYLLCHPSKYVTYIFLFWQSQYGTTRECADCFRQILTVTKIPAIATMFSHPRTRALQFNGVFRGSIQVWRRSMSVRPQEPQAQSPRSEPIPIPIRHVNLET